MENKTTLRRILIIDDDSDYRKLLLNWLGNQFPGVEVVEHDLENGGVPGADFDWSSFDVLLLDYDLNLGRITGLDILQANHENSLFPATIMLTGAGNEDVAVQALKSGVTDYLRKERLDKEQLKEAVEYAFAQQVSKREHLNTLQEAIQIAQAESRKVIASFKSKYAKLRELEVKRVKAEREKIEQDLQEKQELLQKIEQERQKAEELRKSLLAEKEKLENSKTTARADTNVNEQLERTQEHLVLANNGINRIKQDYEDVKAAMAKTQWKQEQGFEIQQHLENDMSSFKNEMEQHEKRLAQFNEKMKERLGVLKDIARSKKETEMKHDKNLIEDISSMLDKEDE